MKNTKYNIIRFLGILFAMYQSYLFVKYFSSVNYAPAKLASPLLLKLIFAIYIICPNSLFNSNVKLRAFRMISIIVISIHLAVFPIKLLITGCAQSNMILILFSTLQLLLIACIPTSSYIHLFPQRTDLV